MRRFNWVGLCFALSAAPALAAAPVSPAAERFSAAANVEVPDFRRHTMPLLGRLGCTGRACHGSFQGQGGFRLSLFGHDFNVDHAALVGGNDPRVDLDDPDESLIVLKPTLTEQHKGGKRFERNSWEHRMLRAWIAGGAKGYDEQAAPEFVGLEVQPQEIIFRSKGEAAQLKVVAAWSNGLREDVTCLCRFTTNNDEIALVDDNGRIESSGVGGTHVIVTYDNGVEAVSVLSPVSDLTGDRYPQLATRTRIDELVADRLRKLAIVPSELCEDAEFLRRVSLDMTGTLPAPREVEQFLADQSSDKRARKVDELLERPAFSAWWATRLGDWMGNNAQWFVDAYHGRLCLSADWQKWMAKRIADNVGYDSLIAGIAGARSRLPGQTYEEYAAEMSSYVSDDNRGDFVERPMMPFFYARRNNNDLETRALSFAHAFLGLKLECAQCHKHPFDRWTQQDFREFAAFFAKLDYGVPSDAKDAYDRIQKETGMAKLSGSFKNPRYKELASAGATIAWRELFINPELPEQRAKLRKKQGLPEEPIVDPRLLGGDVVHVEGSEDPREALMAWMRLPENPYFAPAFVNRVWASYFGVGIVDPPDDQNRGNPPSNVPLLDYLCQQFVARGFDMKWLHREIAGSDAYQRSSRTTASNRLDRRNFSHALLRRLPAEVVYDALYQATSPDKEIESWQADMRSRAIGWESGQELRRTREAWGAVGRVFGKPEREINCDCERIIEPNLSQTLFLRNATQVSELIGGKKRWLWEQTHDERLEAGPHRVQVLEEFVRLAYLRTVSHEPGSEDREVAMRHLNESDDVRRAMEELLWSLINTSEFLVNH